MQHYAPGYHSQKEGRRVLSVRALHVLCGACYFSIKCLPPGCVALIVSRRSSQSSELQGRCTATALPLAALSRISAQALHCCSIQQQAAEQSAVCRVAVIGLRTIEPLPPCKQHQPAALFSWRERDWTVLGAMRGAGPMALLWLDGMMLVMMSARCCCLGS
jgi:hypothetical protein